MKKQKLRMKKPQKKLKQLQFTTFLKKIIYKFNNKFLYKLVF